MSKSSTETFSVGIIMDGNRRFAKERGLLGPEGHLYGAEKMKEVLEWARAQSVTHLVMYAFSTENWNRSEDEVGKLLLLLGRYLDKDLTELVSTTALRFIGETHRFPEALCIRMKELEEDSKDNAIVLAIALSYGGRADILQAVNQLIEEGVETVTEEDLAEHLLTAGIPDPDLVIRTGGEKRLSNFLPWQTVYSELVFTETLWPALTKEEFDRHILNFKSRKRNFGV